MRKPRSKAGGKWVFVEDKSLTPEERHHRLEEDAMEQVGFINQFPIARERYPFAAFEEYQNYVPGDNKVPDGGCWILIKHPPPTPYTVPPMSIWFAEPWPMDGHVRLDPHRVKIVTPKGELGVFPREYVRVKDPAKYYEFIGDGMEIHFFGNEEGVPKDQLFYLRSRGISKRDAMCLLIAEIKSHGIMWIEADEEIQRTFTRDDEMPAKERLATL